MLENMTNQCGNSEKKFQLEGLRVSYRRQVFGVGFEWEVEVL